MTRVLLVKMSSMGDVIHAFPAITEAREHIPDLICDWVVEEAFADLPRLHPAVGHVFPVGFRRLRKKPLAMLRSEEWRQFVARLRLEEYDYVIDAQSLLKSAWVARQSGRPVHGLDFSSAREGLASLFYRHRYHVAKGQFAIDRIRQLFAQVMGYEVGAGFPGYAIDRHNIASGLIEKPYLFFLHSTAWTSKQWPDSYWQELLKMANQSGLKVLMTGGSMEEQARAKLIADKGDNVTVLPRLELMNLAAYLADAQLVVGLDTGLTYLASALGVPTLTLYGATRPELAGDVNPMQGVMSVDFPCAPCHKRRCYYKGAARVYPACYETLPPELVWIKAREMLGLKR
jgi:heptosyltransferase I